MSDAQEQAPAPLTDEIDEILAEIDEVLDTDAAEPSESDSDDA
jgi:hypothetical protein